MESTRIVVGSRPMVERPEVFHWNFAITQANDRESNDTRTTVMGLALISGQLDRIIELLESSDGD